MIQVVSDAGLEAIVVRSRQPGGRSGDGPAPAVLFGLGEWHHQFASLELPRQCSGGVDGGLNVGLLVINY